MSFNEVGNMNKPRKLNVFQRGILQQSAVVAVYAVSCIAAVFLLDRLEKSRFIGVAEQARQKEIINQETALRLKMIINTPDTIDICLITLAVFASGAAVWWLMRRATGLNWSWPVTLPKAVEFSSAMRKMGKFDFVDQLAFVQKHHLRVYIAATPIHGEQLENVRAKLYPRSHNNYLVLESVLTTNIGQRLLCLDADDYEPVYQQFRLATNAADSVRVAELEDDIKALKGTISIKEADNAALTQENAKIREEIAEFRKKEQTAHAREGKAQKDEQSKIPFWRVAGPLINRFIKEAGPETRYTRPQIQSEFEKALEKHPELKPAIEVLLHTDKKENEGLPLDLEGWAMKLIREALGEYAKKDGGAAKKG